LSLSDAHRWAAVAAWVATRLSTASRLKRRPVHVENSGSPGSPPRSASQTLRTALHWMGQRDGALLASLAFDADMTAGAKRDVAAVKRDEL